MDVRLLFVSLALGGLACSGARSIEATRLARHRGGGEVTVASFVRDVVGAQSPSAAESDRASSLSAAESVRRKAKSSPGRPQPAVEQDLPPLDTPSMLDPNPLPPLPPLVPAPEHQLVCTARAGCG